MAIKYTRNKPGLDRPSKCYEPPALFGSARQTTYKRQIMFISVGVCGLIIALSLANISDRFDTFEGQPTLRGAALVIDKLDDSTLSLELNGMPTTHITDPQVYERLKPRDHVAVLYQRSRSGKRVNILEIGTAPIPAHP